MDESGPYNAPNIDIAIRYTVKTENSWGVSGTNTFLSSFLTCFSRLAGNTWSVILTPQHLKHVKKLDKRIEHLSC